MGLLQARVPKCQSRRPDTDGSLEMNTPMQNSRVMTVERDKALPDLSYNARRSAVECPGPVDKKNQRGRIRHRGRRVAGNEADVERATLVAYETPAVTDIEKWLPTTKYLIPRVRKNGSNQSRSVVCSGDDCVFRDEGPSNSQRAIRANPATSETTPLDQGGISPARGSAPVRGDYCDLSGDRRMIGWQ